VREEEAAVREEMTVKHRETVRDMENQVHRPQSKASEPVGICVQGLVTCCPLRWQRTPKSQRISLYVSDVRVPPALRVGRNRFSGP